MGLAQKRIVAEYQKENYEKWKSEVNGIVGYDLPIEVKWDTMQSDDYSDKDQYFNWYPMVYFSPLKDALSSICADSMGKEALQSALKKIVIDGTEGSSPDHSSFENGTLMIRHKFMSNVDNVSDRAKGWTKMLEAKL